MHSEEKELIHQARSGNHWAFEKLIRQYDRQVLSMAYQFVGNTPDAEDIFQEVMLRVYQNIKNFRMESQFYTWLYRIVVNSSLSYRKKRNPHKHISMDHFRDEKDNWQFPDTDKASAPDTDLLNREIREQISDTLDRLPMMQRIVFILRFNEEFKLNEIAEIIGCTTGTVKNHLFRCTKKMRQALAAYIQV